MKNELKEFLSYIENQTEISVDFSSVVNIGIYEADNIVDIDTIESLTMATYSSEIYYKGYLHYLSVEHHSTETNSKIAHVLVQSYSGAADFICGLQVIDQVKEAFPELPVNFRCM